MKRMARNDSAFGVSQKSFPCVKGVISGSFSVFRDGPFRSFIEYNYERLDWRSTDLLVCLISCFAHNFIQ